jgi:hypothetical protein
VYADDDGAMTPYPPRLRGTQPEPSPEPERPKRCPGCGWEPKQVTFRVVYDSLRPGEGNA